MMTLEEVKAKFEEMLDELDIEYKWVETPNPSSTGYRLNLGDILVMATITDSCTTIMLAQTDKPHLTQEMLVKGWLPLIMGLKEKIKINGFLLDTSTYGTLTADQGPEFNKMCFGFYINEKQMTKMTAKRLKERLDFISLIFPHMMEYEF